MWNVHACVSPDAFADVIVEAAAFRVFERSPFGYCQDPDANGLGAAASVTGGPARRSMLPPPGRP